MEEYIQHHRTTPIENEAGEIPGMGVQRKRQANMRANWEIYRGIEGLEGVLLLFWADFWADFYGNTQFFFVFTVSCAGLAFGSLLLPPEEAPA